MDGRIIISLVFIALFILILIFGIREERESKKKMYKKVKNEYGKKRKITDKSVNLFEHHKKFLADNYCVDNITCNDIELNKLFSSVNHTKSSIGQEYLYYQLKRGRLSPKELEDFDRLVNFFSANAELRFSLLTYFESLGKNADIDIDRYFDKDKKRMDGSLAIHLLCWIFYIVAAILLYAYTGAGVIAVIFSISFGIFIYFGSKSKLTILIDSAFYIVKLVEVSKSVSKLVAKTDEAILDKLSADISEKATSVSKALTSYKYVSLSSTGSRNVLSSIVLYINMLLHLDIVLFRGIDKRLIEKEDDVRQLIDYLGAIEAALAIDSYRASLEVYCKPEFSNELVIKDIYHPLLEDAVKNDVSLSKSMLITGANASGKSTFLKAMALGTIMAQTICTVCASSYKMPMLRTYTSMALKDNVQDGDSFFMAEIKSLKRIVDARTLDADRVICFVDEILKGTNTVERIAASSQVTKYLVDSGVICVFATHDIELSALLDDIINNVHFEEGESESKEDVCFTYKLMEGPATSRNAIKLLGKLGMDADLVGKAQNMADRFETSREWAM